MKEIKIKVEDEVFECLQEFADHCKTSVEWVAYWLLRVYAELDVSATVEDICNAIKESDC